MIKNKVYGILKEYLDTWLFGFDKSQMEMSILTGNVDLKNVIIRPDQANKMLE
jgi:hypothetical protein